LAISKRTRYEVLRRDRYTCRFCGASAPDVLLEVDHVIPRHEGGGDIASNLQVLCADCNAGKSATMPERWLVAEVKQAERAFQRNGRQPVESSADDDYAEMYAYMDAYHALSGEPAERVLRCIMRVAADVYPYRPTAGELAVAAAKLVSEGYAASVAEVAP
jgi:hypothetical protein